MTRRKPRFRVVVEPLRSSVTPAEIASLFHPLEVRSIVLSQHGGCFSATVALYTQRDMDIACLRNHTMFGGHQLRVYCPGTEPASPTHSDASEGIDMPQKNLYVLNVPLDVTTVQLERLFAQYGTVRHCVILSMLDGQARRRGFVDMDSPQEAQAALHATDGKVWFGYPLEVSFARVQRSGAPVDAEAAETPCSTLLVRGLVPAATIDADDVHALLAPHAAVAHVEFPETACGQDTFSVRVTLVRPEDAPAVHRGLHGTVVNGQEVHIECDRS